MDQEEEQERHTLLGKTTTENDNVTMFYIFMFSRIITFLHSEDGLLHMHVASWKSVMSNAECTLPTSGLAPREAIEECWFLLDNQKHQ